MAKPEEICEIVANGRRYRAWTSVSVTSAHDEAVMVGAFSVVEDATGLSSFAGLQLLPGDSVSVSLAGKVAMAGFAVDRQAGYDARSHRVQIVCYSKTGDLAHSNVELKGGQFKKSTFEQIAKRILEPFGIPLRVENGGPDAGKPFPDVSVTPGETAMEFVNRLATMRGLFLTTDSSGALIAHRLGGGGVFAELVEGKNIVAASCQINDLTAFKTGQVVGQQKGSDTVDGEAARKPAAAVDWGSFDRHKHLLTFPELPGDETEMKIRAEHMARVQMAAKINATVVVQGWLAPNGDLWRIRERVLIKSPLLVLNHVLGIARVVFSQDESGTKTTLFLIRPEAMGATAPLDLPGGPQDVLPGGTPGEAQIESEAA